LNQVEFVLKIWLNQNCSQIKNEMLYIYHVVGSGAVSHYHETR